MSRPARLRASYVIFVDGAPVSSCMARDSEDALAFARQWVDERDYASLSVVAEADCTPDDLAALNASESARCDGWTKTAGCLPCGDDLVILADHVG